MTPRIIFFGTEQWAARFLDYLIYHNLKPIAVVTNVDKPAGRGLRMVSPPVKAIALAHSLLVLQPQECYSEKFLAELRCLAPTLGVLIAYGKILTHELLKIPKLGFINVHPSLLPLYRGPSPFVAPILNGSPETGVSIIQMDEEMDHGSILSQEHIAIEKYETVQTLQEKVIARGCPLLVTTIHSLLKGSLTAIPQDHSRATYTKRMTKESGKINWSKSALEIERMVRALNPWPGTWTLCRGKRLKILEAMAVDGGENKTDQSGSFQNQMIVCGKGFLKPHIVQIEGKRSLSFEEFQKGYSALLTGRCE